MLTPAGAQVLRQLTNKQTTSTTETEGQGGDCTVSCEVCVPDIRSFKTVCGDGAMDLVSWHRVSSAPMPKYTEGVRNKHNPGAKDAADRQ